MQGSIHKHSVSVIFNTNNATNKRAKSQNTSFALSMFREKCDPTLSFWFVRTEIKPDQFHAFANDCSDTHQAHVWAHTPEMSKVVSAQQLVAMCTAAYSSRPGTPVKVRVVNAHGRAHMKPCISEKEHKFGQLLSRSSTTCGIRIMNRPLVRNVDLSTTTLCTLGKDDMSTSIQDMMKSASVEKRLSSSKCSTFEPWRQT